MNYSISDVVSYLKNPLIYKANELFSEPKDDFDRNPLEPIGLSLLQKSVLQNALIRAYLSDLAECKEISDTLKSQFPFYTYMDEQFRVRVRSELQKNIDLIQDRLEQYAGKFYKKSAADFVSDFVKEKRLEIEVDKEIELDGQVSWHKFGGDELLLIDFAKDTGIQRFLKMYVSSLALVASASDRENYNVKLGCFSYCDYSQKAPDFFKKNKEEPRSIFYAQREFSLSKGQAANILSSVFHLMGEKKQSFCSISMIQTRIDNLSDFINKVENSKDWKYFDYKNLIDIKKDLGYTNENFSNEWKHICDIQRSLILFDL